MKKAVLVLAMAIFSLSVNAQAKLVKNEIDSFTGDTKKITDTYLIGKSKTNSRLSAKIMRINESRFISLIDYLPPALSRYPIPDLDLLNLLSVFALGTLSVFRGPRSVIPGRFVFCY